MTEPLRRLTIEAELPEHLAVEIEAAVADGKFDSVAGVIESALVIWSYERWSSTDPAGWHEHVEDMKRRIADADAHPEDSMEVGSFFEQLRGEMETWDAEASTAGPAE